MASWGPSDQWGSFPALGHHAAGSVTAGTLVLVGLLLGLFVSTAFFGVSAFVGAGLTIAGMTGWYGSKGAECYALEPASDHLKR